MQADIERVLIAEVICDPRVFYEVQGIFKGCGSRYFQDDKLAVVYQAMETLTAYGLEIDILTLSEELRKTGNLDYVGGRSFIADISDMAVSSAFSGSHAEIIVQRYQDRELARYISVVQSELQKGVSSENVIPDIIRKCQSIIELKTGSNTKHISVHVREVVAESQAAKNTRGVVGIKSGMSWLDDMTGGFSKSDYVILAARPSTGKTAVAKKIIKRASQQAPALFFSIEESPTTVTHRLIGTEAGIDDRKIKRGLLDSSEERRFMDAAALVAGDEIYIDSSPAPTVQYIETTVRKYRREKKIGIVVIDYIGKIRAEHGRSRQEEVAEISQRLKALQLETGIPFIVLAQLNRKAEERTGPPELADLREAGDLEQDADIVIFLHSFERKNIREVPPGYGQFTGIATKDLMTIRIAKQRSGPIGDNFVNYNPVTGRITDLEIKREHEQNYSTDDLPF